MFTSTSSRSWEAPLESFAYRWICAHSPRPSCSNRLIRSFIFVLARCRAVKHAGLSDLVFDGVCATFIYTVGEVSVSVHYAPDGEERGGKDNAWHPTVPSDYLKIRDF